MSLKPWRSGINDDRESPKLTLVTGDVVDAIAYETLRSAVLGITRHGIGHGHVDVVEPIDLHADDAMSVIAESYYGRYRVTVEKLPPHFGTMERGA